MTSREIIIKLIDTNLINGEEAFTLINDILVAEIKAAMETLKESSQSDSLHLKWNQDNWKVTSTPWTNTWGTIGSSTISGTASSIGDCSAAYGINSSSVTAAIGCDQDTICIKDDIGSLLSR